MRYKQDRLCHQRQTDINRYKLYITYIQINFLFRFFSSVILKIEVEKVIEYSDLYLLYSFSLKIGLNERMKQEIKNKVIELFFFIENKKSTIWGNGR